MSYVESKRLYDTENNRLNSNVVYGFVFEFFGILALFGLFLLLNFTAGPTLTAWLFVGSIAVWKLCKWFFRTISQSVRSRSP